MLCEVGAEIWAIGKNAEIAHNTKIMMEVPKGIQWDAESSQIGKDMWGKSVRRLRDIRQMAQKYEATECRTFTKFLAKWRKKIKTMQGIVHLVKFWSIVWEEYSCWIWRNVRFLTFDICIQMILVDRNLCYESKNVLGSTQGMIRCANVFMIKSCISYPMQLFSEMTAKTINSDLI